MFSTRHSKFSLAVTALSVMLVSAIGQPSVSRNVASGNLCIADASATSGFTDIKDVDGEKQIKDLVRLGVLQPATGKFQPDKPITRAEFVAWLVRSNNALRPDANIKLASASAPATFSDMPSSNPYFRYVQGMANAGWAVGYDDKTFKPAQALTREEMISIKTPLDAGKDLRNEDRTTIQAWSDWQKISKRHKGAMCFEAAWEPNWVRCFGKTKSASPQAPVTRAEAAICVWQLGFSDGRVNPDLAKK